VQIEQDEIHVPALQHVQCSIAVGCFEDLEALARSHLAEQLADLGIVVDQEQEGPRLSGVVGAHNVGESLPVILISTQAGDSQGFAANFPGKSGPVVADYRDGTDRAFVAVK
jgi:hypothetical protein